MRSGWLAFICRFIILLASLTLSTSALAAPPELVLEIVPETVELRPDVEALVTVVLRNPSDQTVTNVQLTTQTNSTIQVTDDQGEPTTLLPHAAEAWDLRVKQGEQGPDAGKVYVRVNYQWQDSDENGTLTPPVSRVLIGSFDVTAPEIPSVADIAGIEIDSTLTSLNEQRPGTVYLLLENKKDIPLEVVEIVARGPSFVEINREEDEAITLAPREIATIPYAVSATDIVQPGKHLLVFDIKLAWQEEGQSQESTFVTKHEVDVGVFGESQILSLLGVPAFFLLPGFLLLIILKLLLKAQNTQAATTPWFLDIKNYPAEFAALAITISLVAALLYPSITERLLGARRNYLEAYGLDDIFYLWFAALIVALLLFPGWLTVKAIGRWWQRRQEQKRVRLAQLEEQEIALRTHAVGDDPVTTIQKLARRGMNLKVDQVEFDVDPKTYTAYVLQGDQASETLWIAPMICITNRDRLDTDAQADVYKAINEGTIQPFLNLIEQLQLDWKRAEGSEPLWPEEVTIPYECAQADIKGFKDFPAGQPPLVDFC